MAEKTFEVTMQRIIEVKVVMTGISAGDIRRQVRESVDNGDSVISDIFYQAAETGTEFDTIVAKNIRLKAS